MRRTSRIGTAFGLFAALGLVSSSAPAQNLELSELAAALALPVITGGQPSNTIKATRGDVVLPLVGNAISLLTVTNGRNTATTLKIDVISGDPNTPFVGGDNWQSDSFDCLLTGRETVTFLVVSNNNPVQPGSIIYAECSNAGFKDGIFADNLNRGVGAANGIMFVAAGDPVPPGDISPAISQDILFGDAVVIDILAGQAYSFSGIPFQAGGAANNGDKVYKFDGQEYSQWPSSLASNFIAPDNTPEVFISAELILFTLDGAVGSPPRVNVTGLVWDDDEIPSNWDHTFDCFDIVALNDISAQFTQPFMGPDLIFGRPGSLSGHFTMTPQPTSSGGVDTHDAQFGDSNNSRRRPVHGWIVQSVVPAGIVVLPLQPTTVQPNFVFNGAGFSAWGRPLSQNRFSLAPFLADQDPVLDAESSNP